MAYTIYVLDESDLTVTSPTGLDGVTQGDGSHLNGQTMTIGNPVWTPIAINDNDLNFSDNDSSQTLDGAQEIDGTTYASGTRLEAEFSFDVSYNGDTWTMIAFNVREPGGGSSYGTIEGLAVIGGPGDFPPPNVVLSISNAQEGPSYAATGYSTPICFDTGCPILTPQGYRMVEDLRAGDEVMTADNGAQTILWAGSRKAFGIARFAPVEIEAGVLGNDRTLRVSQQHRILIGGAEAQLFFGEDEVLVPAHALLGKPGIQLVSGNRVNFHHLLLADHEVIDCAGMATETLLPTEYGLAQLSEASQEEVRQILKTRPAYLPARPILRAYEATLLAA